RLIEGRKPNYFISAVIAKVTGQQTDYFKKKGIDDEYCRKMILDYLDQFGSATRAQLEEVLLDKLPGILTERQRKDKVKNNLQALKTKKQIKLNSKRKWVIV